LNTSTKKVNRNVEYKEPIINLLILFVFLGLVGAVLLKLFIKFRNFFINNKLWFVGSIIIYFVCMAGVVYDIIHGVPFTNIDRAGNFEWYHSGSRSQFGLEGFLMSGAIVFAGLMFILFQFLPKLSGLGMSGTVSYIVVSVLIYLAFAWVEDIYHKKSGFYNPAFWPPAHYIKGPLMRDQGNNI